MVHSLSRIVEGIVVSGFRIRRTRLLSDDGKLPSRESDERQKGLDLE
jgi:hypothetical protein